MDHVGLHGACHWRKLRRSSYPRPYKQGKSQAAGWWICLVITKMRIVFLFLCAIRKINAISALFACCLQERAKKRVAVKLSSHPAPSLHVDWRSKRSKKSSGPAHGVWSSTWYSLREVIRVIILWANYVMANYGFILSRLSWLWCQLVTARDVAVRNW